MTSGRERLGSNNCDKDIRLSASVYLNKLWHILLGECMFVRTWGVFLFNMAEVSRDKYEEIQKNQVA
jgi:hypothetical protein